MASYVSRWMQGRPIAVESSSASKWIFGRPFAFYVPEAGVTHHVSGTIAAASTLSVIPNRIRSIISSITAQSSLFVFMGKKVICEYISKLTRTAEYTSKITTQVDRLSGLKRQADFKSKTTKQKDYKSKLYEEN